MLMRRSFLLGAPLVLGATRKSGSGLPVVGAGEHRYEVHHDWGRLPSSIRYGNTHGVVEDSSGRIYVHHTVGSASQSSDSMVVFDADGTYVKSWGADFRGGAHGLHINKEPDGEFLYLCDTKRALVVKSTLEGEEVLRLGYPRESDKYPVDRDGKPAVKYSPTNLAVAPNGDLYVADGYGSSYINRYDRNGGYLGTFGGPGDGPGQLNCPHGIFLDTRGGGPVLRVADRGNHRIQNFSLDGRHLGFTGGTNLPCHFHTHASGLMVVPDLGARVTLFDARDRVVAHLGDDSASDWKQTRRLERERFTPGKFVCPHGACFDRRGNVFIVEWVEVGRVTRLRRLS